MKHTPTIANLENLVTTSHYLVSQNQTYFTKSRSFEALNDSVTKHKPATILIGREGREKNPEGMWLRKKICGVFNR